MKFSQILAVGATVISSVVAKDYVYERLDKEQAMVLVVDHQVGLFNLVRDLNANEFETNMIAHAALGKTFNLPVVMTTSAETGPNGPLPKEIQEMYPDAPLILRNGEVNAWDNPEFREAVQAANRTQIIIGGIVTDVCTAFLAQSLREEGYSVWANVEASGTISQLARETANDNMRDAGVHISTLFAIIAELMRDWRNTPGAADIFPFLGKYFPVGSYVFRAHAAAVLWGELAEGQEELVTIETPEGEEN